MKKDKLFYVPFMVKDWVVDTQELTLLERGAYITILSNMYLKEDGIIQEKSLPNLLGLKGKNYTRVMSNIKPFLIEVNKGKITMQILKEILKENKINQVQLASNLDISVSLLSNIMNNKRNISVNLANKLHDKYNIAYEVLLNRSNSHEER